MFFFNRQSRISVSQVLVVGVHARRTDYKRWLSDRAHGKPVTKEFYLQGMEIFRSRFHTCDHHTLAGCKAVAFLMASDDLKWCKDNFGKETNVFFSQFKTKELDMSMLQHCDHVLSRSDSCSTFLR